MDKKAWDTAFGKNQVGTLQPVLNIKRSHPKGILQSIPKMSKVAETFRRPKKLER